MTASPPPSPGAKVGNICRAGAGPRFLEADSRSSRREPRPISAQASLCSFDRHLTQDVPQGRGGDTWRRLSPGTFNQLPVGQVLSWPGFYTANSSFLAKRAVWKDQTALEFPDRHQLSLFSWKKKKFTPGRSTPGGPACWSHDGKHAGGTQGWACAGSGGLALEASGSIVPTHPWPAGGPASHRTVAITSLPGSPPGTLGWVPSHSPCRPTAEDSGLGEPPTRLS